LIFRQRRDDDKCIYLYTEHCMWIYTTLRPGEYHIITTFNVRYSTKNMIKLFCFSVLYLQISVISSRLISRQIQYKGTDKKPADLTIIEVLSDTSEVATCLLYCSKKTDCKSVVYEDTKCYLYSTSVGSLPLASGQKAIAEFSTGNPMLICS